MRDAGWDVTAVCSDGSFIEGLREQGYQIRTVSISRSMNPITSLRTIIQLVHLFKSEHYDVLHVHTPVAALLGRVAARIAGIPLCIYTAHGFYFHDEMPGLKRRIFVSLERIGGWFTDYLFTQSAEDAEAASQLGIMPAHKVLAIGNGADVEVFNPEKHSGDVVRKSLGIPSEARVIGIIGRLVREKGYVEFLKAAEVIGNQYKDIYFLIIGERLQSDHNKHIDNELARMQDVLGDRMILAGMREDIPELLAAMDIFCLPSYREGMPRTIIEAMLMARPVVATDIRGAREEVVHNETGILIETRNSDALIKAFARLLDDEKLQVRFGQEGRKRALAMYDERHVVSLQIDKLHELTKC